MKRISRIVRYMPVGIASLGAIQLMSHDNLGWGLVVLAVAVAYLHNFCD